MLAKHLAMALLGTALVSAPALAQTQPQNQPAGSPPAAAQPSTTAPSSSAMSTGNWMTQEQPGQWRASKLEGLDVYNQNNEKIGDISEMIVDQSGKVQAVVIGVGGFLGMGERDVAIPFDQIKFVNEPRAVATTAPTTGPAGTTGTTTTAPTTTGTVATTDRTAADAAARAAPDHAVLTVNMTKDQLKAAPEFKYNR